ncbi:hypothetical protein BGC_41350 [Burkholderia sp. 3C]
MTRPPLDHYAGRQTPARGDVDGDFWASVAFRDGALRVCGNGIFREVPESMQRGDRVQARSVLDPQPGCRRFFLGCVQGR